jgi:carboxyl-terminal processing protease
MKKLLLFLLFTAITAKSQDTNNFCSKINRVVELIKLEHFKPKPIDDSLSVYVFDSFIQKLDPDRTLFIAEEINQLTKFTYTIDNAVLENDCRFFNDFFQLYKKGLIRKKKIIEDFEKERLQLNTKDTIFFSKGKLKPVKDEARLKKLIKKRITFDVLETIATKSKNKDSLSAHFDTLSKEIERLAFEKYNCEISLLLGNDNQIIKLLEDHFLTVLCSYFDPHTAYFSFEGKEDYMSNLRTDNETFGIIFNDSENDELFVTELIPGSIAYLSDKIEIGDQLLKITVAKDEFPVQCNYFSKINEVFTDPSKKYANFTFLKKSGEIYSLNLEKKKLKTIENEVFSSVLIKDKKRFGYINIPSFYMDEANLNTVSKDVAKEVIHLKNEAVEGLIIDVQNNGGGSMTEAINLVGMFIDIGPVSVLADNHDKKTILKDFNRGMIFNKPIVVIVNGFSASASELFANAIQDYKRGIIIGSKTYGKGTSQQIFPLASDNESMGFIKITKDKFYRINGNSHQKNGVSPDVFLPVLMENIMPRESKALNALEGDFLNYPIRYEVMNNDFSKVILNSSNRVSKMEYFSNIIAINNQIDLYVNGEKKPVIVNFNNVFNDTHATDEMNNDIRKLSNYSFDFEIRNTTALEEKIKHDEYLQEYNKLKKKQLQCNAYAFEAIQILLELSN